MCNLQNNDRMNINSTSLPLSLLLKHTHTHTPKYNQVNKQNIYCTFNVFLLFLLPKLQETPVAASPFPPSAPSIT